MLIKANMSIGGLLATLGHFRCDGIRNVFGVSDGLLRRKFGPLTATTMHHDSQEPAQNVTGSFNGLLSRMASLDHTGILRTGRKILKQAKKDRVEATMTMSEVIQMTGMTKEDLDFFISCRLIAVTEPADDPTISFRDVFCLVKIFSPFVDQVVIPERSTSRQQMEEELLRKPA